MNYLNALKSKMNNTTTTNGANALKSTRSSVLDLYSIIGALRHRTEIDIENYFSKAFSENRLLAMKLLFYARDIRGGLGERRIFRIIIKHLAKLYPDVLRQNLSLVSYYGRWDDLFVLLDTELHEDVMIIIKNQLMEDIHSTNPSLLAKWLPSINASSQVTRKHAMTIATGLNFDAKNYRKTLSALRKRMDVTEVKMSSGQWTAINYEKVPSNAMNIYSNAFMRNDNKRFTGYIEAVKDGEKKVNASVLFPYNITEKILYGHNINHELLEQQWNNMPDFVMDSQKNVLVMADVSGSMNGRPMATSIGLALYFSQRSKGFFANCFMTFSESPSLIEVTGHTLYEKVRMILSSHWGMNTDFEKALNVLLDTAVENNIRPSELPEKLIVVSDMQFDSSINNTNKDWTFYKKMKQNYRNKGYSIPEIVFWNVNSMTDVFQATDKMEGVKMASGQSVSVFKSILCDQTLTPYDSMLEVLNDERYEAVRI